MWTINVNRKILSYSQMALWWLSCMPWLSLLLLSILPHSVLLLSIFWIVWIFMQWKLPSCQIDACFNHCGRLKGKIATISFYLSGKLVTRSYYLISFIPFKWLYHCNFSTSVKSSLKPFYYVLLFSHVSRSYCLTFRSFGSSIFFWAPKFFKFT